MNTTTKDLRTAVLALCEALDPGRQGEQWPDPIAWDGRPLVEQAHDLLALAGVLGPLPDRLLWAVDEVRAALAKGGAR